MKKIIFIGFLILCFCSNLSAQISSPETFQVFFGVENNKNIANITIEGSMPSHITGIYILIGDDLGKSNIGALKIDPNMDQLIDPNMVYQIHENSTQIKLIGFPREVSITVTLRTDSNEFLTLIPR